MLLQGRTVRADGLKNIFLPAVCLSWAENIFCRKCALGPKTSFAGSALLGRKHLLPEVRSWAENIFFVGGVPLFKLYAFFTVALRCLEIFVLN